MLILTLCAEDTFGWLWVANGVETGRTLTDGVVPDLDTEGVLVVVDAGLIVETLIAQLFGCSSGDSQVWWCVCVSVVVGFTGNGCRGCAAVRRWKMRRTKERHWVRKCCQTERWHTMATGNRTTTSTHTNTQTRTHLWLSESTDLSFVTHIVLLPGSRNKSTLYSFGMYSGKVEETVQRKRHTVLRCLEICFKASIQNI